jgi:hypothetical protein
LDIGMSRLCKIGAIVVFVLPARLPSAANTKTRLCKIGAIVVFVLAALGSLAGLIEAVGQEVEAPTPGQVPRGRGELEPNVGEQILPPGDGIIEYAPPGEEKPPIKLRNSTMNQIGPPGEEGFDREAQPKAVAASSKVTPPAMLSELRSFAVYALSRGRGVPEGARDTLTKFRNLLEKAEKAHEVVRFTEQRIGLEGETKICAEFRSPEFAEKAWSEIQRIAGDQELIDIRVERCRKK